MRITLSVVVLLKALVVASVLLEVLERDEEVQLASLKVELELVIKRVVK